MAVQSINAQETKKNILLLLCFITISCTTTKTVSYRIGKSPIKYKLEIPKGYIFEGIAGDHEFEKRYWYPDSSVIYITTFSNTLNYDEIRSQGTYYQRFQAIHSNDTLTLAGQDSTGMFWKDKKLKYITVGYSNVPLSGKAVFDKAIDSAR